MIVDALVEGLLDEIVARTLIRHCGHTDGTVYGKQGISYIQSKLAGFNVQAKFGNPLLVLVDFVDTKLDCPPSVIKHWLSNRERSLLLRVVVCEIESWLMADHHGLAEFLGISTALVPATPETLIDPKQTLVNLARRCRRRQRREGIVPVQGITTKVGPGYVAELAEFVEHFWNPDRAKQQAPSLAKCLDRLTSIQ